MLSAVPFFFEKECCATCYYRKTKVFYEYNGSEPVAPLFKEMGRSNSILRHEYTLSRLPYQTFEDVTMLFFLTGCLHETAPGRFLPGSYYRHAGSCWWQEWERGTLFSWDLQSSEGFMVLYSRLAEVTGVFGKLSHVWRTVVEGACVTGYPWKGGKGII